MAISIKDLFSEFNLELRSPVKWNTKFKAKYNGVYVIALTNNGLSNESHNSELIIDEIVFNEWIKEAPDLEIEGKKVTTKLQVETYLKSYWKKEENILYIGESTSVTNPLEKRVNQFYTHKVGKKGPHSGGYWLKLISCLTDTYIYYVECARPRETEFKLIMKFVELQAKRSFFEIDDFSSYFPFANLKIDILKGHSLRKNTNSNVRK